MLDRPDTIETINLIRTIIIREHPTKQCSLNTDASSKLIRVWFYNKLDAQWGEIISLIVKSYLPKEIFKNISPLLAVITKVIRTINSLRAEVKFKFSKINCGWNEVFLYNFVIYRPDKENNVMCIKLSVLMLERLPK